MLSTTQWIVLLAVVGLVALVTMVLFSARALRRRHAELQLRFGPEYDREVEERGSASRAERELLAREKRVRKQRLRPLAEADRARFSANWVKLQARFVDDPPRAVQAADELIKSVMLEQGYEIDSFEQRVADCPSTMPAWFSIIERRMISLKRTARAEPTPRSCGRPWFTTARYSRICWSSR